MTRKRPRKHYRKRGHKREGYHLQIFLYKYEKWFFAFFLVIALAFLFSALSSFGVARGFFNFLAAAFGLFALIFGARWFRRHRFLNRHQTIRRLRRMDPIQFEHYVAHLFHEYGYETKVMGGAGDFGTDVVARKDGKKYVIQCKRYAAINKVKSPEMQGFLGSMHHYRADGGIFVTTSTFTSDAKFFAQKNGILLIDEVKLSSMIAKKFKE